MLDTRPAPRQVGDTTGPDNGEVTLDLSTQWRAHHRDGAPDLYPEHLRDGHT